MRRPPHARARPDSGSERKFHRTQLFSGANLADSERRCPDPRPCAPRLRRGVHVTRAAAFQSQHQFGQAADLAPIKDGKISISERDPWTMEAYQLLGQAAAAEGLVWGGTWTNLRDYGHVEARRSLR